MGTGLQQADAESEDAEADAKTYTDFPASPLEKPGWELVVHDEFDGPELNEELWIPEYMPGRFGNQDPPALKARYYFKDGKIHLSANGEKNFPKKHHTVSSLQTYNCNKLHKWYANWAPTVDKFTQLYGYYEVRAKHVGPSHHVAFWALQAKPGGAEIDITEDRHKVDPSWHSWGAEGWPAERTKVQSHDDITTPEQRATTFNLYALEVTKDGARIYHNNELVEEAKVDWKAHDETPLMFFLSIYGEDRPEAQEYVIDYFRSYKKKDGSNNPRESQFEKEVLSGTET